MTAPIRRPYTACPMCGAPPSNDDISFACTTHALYFAAHASRLEWRVCDHCGHEYTAGALTEEGLAALTRAHPADRANAEGPEMGRHHTAALAERLQWCGYLPPAKVLDVGFGNGDLLGTLDELGYDCAGIDPRPSAVEGMRGHLSRSGLVCTTLRGMTDNPGQEAAPLYDVVCMLDVLEHTEFPLVELKRAVSLLKPGGALVLAFPNRDSWAWRALKREQNPYYWEIEHNHNFALRHVEVLLEDFDMRVLHRSIGARYRLGVELIARKGPAASTGEA